MDISPTSSTSPRSDGLGDDFEDIERIFAKRPATPAEIKYFPQGRVSLQLKEPLVADKAELSQGGTLRSKKAVSGFQKPVENLVALPKKKSAPNKAQIRGFRKKAAKFPVRMAAFIAAAILTFTAIATGVGAIVNNKDSQKKDALEPSKITSEVQDGVVVSPYDVEDATFDLPKTALAPTEVVDTPVVDEASVLETTFNEATKDSSVKETIYEMQVTVDRASETLEQPLINYIQDVCKEHSNKTGLVDWKIPLAIIFKESSGINSVNKDGLMQVTQPAIDELERLYPGKYTNLDPSNPHDNIVLGTAFLDVCIDRRGGDIAKAVELYNSSDKKEEYRDIVMNDYNNMCANPELTQMLEDGNLVAYYPQGEVEFDSPV